MKEETFEKNFPSLYEDTEHMCTDESCERFCWFTIASCCLDKQLLSAKINKLEERITLIRKDHPGLPLVTQAIRDFKEEVGL